MRKSTLNQKQKETIKRISEKINKNQGKPQSSACNTGENATNSSSISSFGRTPAQNAK